MIDLHTHSIFSDGELIPAELIRRAVVHGYTAIAITDHVDFSNVEFILSNLKKIKHIEDDWDIQILAGVEITHVPPGKIKQLVTEARNLGAEIIVVHGETTVEPVFPGTNMAAVNTDIDILAHPGFITIEESDIAKDNGVHLEITSRNGHNRTNGHVARIAVETGADMIVDTDSHGPDDLITDKVQFDIARGAGLTDKRAKEVCSNSHRLLENLGLE